MYKIIIHILLIFFVSASYSQTDSLAQKQQPPQVNSQRDSLAQTDSLAQKQQPQETNSKPDNIKQEKKSIDAISKAESYLSKKKLLEADNKRDELNRRQGVWKIYNADGILLSEIEYKNGEREGKCIIYYPIEGKKVKEEMQYFDGKRDESYVKKFLSGQTAVEGTYAMGFKTGSWTFYYEDGQTKSEGEYDNGKRDGEWKFYDRKGEITRTRKCNNGKCIVKQEK